MRLVTGAWLALWYLACAVLSHGSPASRPVVETHTVWVWVDPLRV